MGTPLTPDDVEHEDDRDRREREQERLLEAERHAPTHCATCGKPLSARLLCHACGDETDHPTWVRGDLSGLAEVFDGLDTGDRRRADDEKAA